MKASLTRFNDNRLGLIIEGLHGRQIVDVIHSLERISGSTGQGMLECFRGVDDWGSILQKWQQLRPALIELIHRTQTSDSDKSELIVFPLDAVRLGQSSASPISVATLQISELCDVTLDPTGREIMARQFSETR